MLNDGKKYAVFTIDVESFGDTGCIREKGIEPEDKMLDGFDLYMELLDELGVPATMFTLADTAPLVADSINKYLKKGHSLALHGNDHSALDTMTTELFESEIRLAKDYMEECFETEIKGYRAPFFSLDNEKLEVLRRLGFTYDSSRMAYEASDHNGHLNLSEFQCLSPGIYKKDDFIEFGMCYEKCLGVKMPVSGGGYIRLCNWMLGKQLISKYLRHSDYYIFYLHPFEIAGRKPEVPKGLQSHERYYLSYGIKNYAKKVKKIIAMLKSRGFEFVTLDYLCNELSKKSALKA